MVNKEERERYRRNEERLIRTVLVNGWLGIIQAYLTMFRIRGYRLTGCPMYTAGRDECCLPV